MNCVSGVQRRWRTFLAPGNTDKHLHPPLNPLPDGRDIMYIQTLHYVHNVCMEAERWTSAVKYGEMVLPAFKRYYGQKTGVVAALLVR